MLPHRVQNRYIQVVTDFSGAITAVDSGVFALSEFIVGTSIYTICPFLETMLDGLPLEKPFIIDGMVISSGDEEYNVDVDLFRTKESISILIINRTNVYQYVKELNQNRNEISIAKHQIDRQNIELAQLRKVAEKANEEKSRFLAMMSHEVRNPLHAILGYANMIATESSSPATLGHIKSLMMAGHNLKIIADDILDLSRIEAGRLELVLEPISLKDTAKLCVKNFYFQHKENSVELKCTVSDKISNQVLGDAVRLTQILSNLISNAFKFTKKGSIALNVTQISETNESANVAFSLSDTGRGMTKEQIGKIFNEYEQVELDDNRVHGGAGLGLSIVKRLVEAMQGTINVESQIEVGTTFTIQIPFKKTAAFNDATTNNNLTPKDLNYNLQGAEILYADDDELNHVIVAHLLSKEGVSITLVNDGPEALSALKKKKFDVVLLDIHMPHKSGEDLIKEKNLFTEFNEKTPILALTGNTNKEDISRYKALGFLDVVSKPFTPEQLTSAISTYFKR